MAIVQNPLIARASGSVGNSIFSKWKDKNTLRSKSINPYPAPSPAQLVQQQKMRDFISLYAILKPYSSLFYDKKPSKFSYLSFLVQKNIQIFLGDVNIVESHLVPTMVFSRTSLPVQSNCSMISSVDNVVTFTLDYFVDPQGLGTLDGCYFIYFNRNTRVFGIGYYQSAGNYFEVVIPDAAITDTVDLFACSFYESPAKCSPFSFITTTNS